MEDEAVPISVFYFYSGKKVSHHYFTHSFSPLFLRWNDATENRLGHNIRIHLFWIVCSKQLNALQCLCSVWFCFSWMDFSTFEDISLANNDFFPI